VFADAALHGAAVLGVQTKATIKQARAAATVVRGERWELTLGSARRQARADRFVERTLDRSVLWEMHTPQVVRPQLLRDGFALVAAEGLAVTDDVSIVEAMGLPVFITQGEYTNLKVTTPEGAEGVGGGLQKSPPDSTGCPRARHVHRRAAFG